MNKYLDKLIFSLFLLLVFLIIPTRAFADTTIFSDDFNDANGTSLTSHNSNWYFFDGVEPTIQNNTLSEPNAVYGHMNIAIPTGDQCSSFDFVYPLNSRKELYLKAKDTPSWYAQSGYYFLLDSPDDVQQNFGIADENGWLVNTGFPTISNGWHNFKACVVGTHLTAYVDNAQIASANSSISYTDGYPRIGLGQNVQIDNFQYFTPDSPVYDCFVTGPEDCVGTFTATNPSYNPTTKILSFGSSNFTPDNTDYYATGYRVIGIFDVTQGQENGFANDTYENFGTCDNSGCKAVYLEGVEGVSDIAPTDVIEIFEEFSPNQTPKAYTSQRMTYAELLANSPAAFVVSGKVYQDVNQNGVQDNSEAGYGNATIGLSTGQTVTTDSNGDYSFPAIPAGSYVDTLTVPDGYTATTTNPVSITLSSNTTVNFGLSSTPVVTTLTPTADSFLNFYAQNNNEGAAPALKIENSMKSKVIVKFDPSQVASAVAGSSSYTASLQFTITSNGNNWGTTGKTIGANRLTKDWTEGNGYINGNPTPNRGTGSGATWKCAIDPNISDNTKNNCSGAADWDLDNSANWPYIATPTATANITNHETGTVSFDVTPDVQAYMNGSGNYGWIINRIDDSTTGKVYFGSRETSDTPQLVITRN